MSNSIGRLKSVSVSTIQYIVIQTPTKKETIGNSILYTTHPTNLVFSILKHLPRDFMQFYDQEAFVKISKIDTQVNPAINVLILSEDLFTKKVNPAELYSQFLKLKNKPVVYIIDSNCSDIDMLFMAISKADHMIWYFTFYGTKKVPSAYLSRKNVFDTVPELIQLFKRDFAKIKLNFSSEASSYKEIEFNVDESDNNKMVYQFKPMLTNYLTLFCLSDKTWRLSYPMEEAISSQNLRAKYLLDLVKEIDIRHNKINQELGQKISYPVLILTFPFLDPDLNSSLTNRVTSKEEKLYVKLFSLEQTLDYLNLFEASNKSDADLAGTALSHLAAPKLELLDCIAYLHSSFTFSPVIRLPLIGKSIYKELSFFNPKTNFFSTAKNKRNKLVLIQRFGEKLGQLTLSAETIDYLIETDRQIFAISDLPIEWLTLKDVPLSFTHDICRIHESNYTGNVNNYSANNRFEYTITGEIIKKTLIILSADENESVDHEFKLAYNLVKIKYETLGFEYRYCKSVKEVSKAVNDVQPYLLIFDCHGNIDQAKGTTYLVINGERLHGEDIIAHRITAPIVYLSCCNTNPNYGYINKIQDAFFEAGAITVTGTFLPISIKRGTNYYLRLLELLRMNISKTMHKNWLEFICYTIRSSIMHDAFSKAIERLGRMINDEETMSLSKLIHDILIFSKRREIFQQLITHGIRLSEDLVVTIDDTDSEFLMYNHYGRPDLILFE